MKLTLISDRSGKVATLGKLYVDGRPECETLEDVVREVPGRPVSAWKVPGKTAIPAGTYRVTITRSNRFSEVASRKAGRPVDVYLPEVHDVPGFTGVRIHVLNEASETEGCVGVGQVRYPTTETIGRSRLAMDALQAKIQVALDRGEEVWLTVARAT